MPAVIGFTGDLIVDIGTVIQEEEGCTYYDCMSAELRHRIASVHECWGNLEAPVTESADGVGTFLALNARPPNWKFFCRRTSLEAFRRLGFTIVGVANNHCFDLGTESDTAMSAHLLKSEGFLPVGLDFSPVVREIDGVSIAVFGVTMLLNRQMDGPRVALLTRRTAPLLFRRLSEWRHRVDHVVVMMHWGREFTFVVPDPIRALARALLDNGASVVYGNHPHVLWPIEQPSPSQLICYSLGNFVQVFSCPARHQARALCERSLDTAFVEVTFERDRVSAAYHPISTSHNFDQWWSATGLRRHFWRWDAEEFSQWRSGIPGRATRLRHRLETIDAHASSPVTHQMQRRLALAARQGGTFGR